MGKIIEDMGYFIIGTCFIASFYSSYPGKPNKEAVYKHKIDSVYNTIVSSKTKDAALIKFLNQYTPFTEKEKIVDGNKLENRIK